MDIMAAAVTTDAMGGFAMHIPNADYEDREIKRSTLMGKAHKLSDWIPIDANAAINMAKKPERAPSCFVYRPLLSLLSVQLNKV
jgi:hypothetical protein